YLHALSTTTASGTADNDANMLGDSALNVGAGGITATNGSLVLNASSIGGSRPLSAPPPHQSLPLTSTRGATPSHPTHSATSSPTSFPSPPLLASSPHPPTPPPASGTADNDANILGDSALNVGAGGITATNGSVVLNASSIGGSGTVSATTGGESVDLT